MKVILYMAMTVNGLIAKENNEAPWSEPIWKSYYDVAKKFNAIILGKKTFEIMKEVKEFEKIGNPFTVVLTKEPFVGDEKFVAAKTPAEAVKILEEKDFEKAMLGGGSQANGSFLKDGLIDEMIIDIDPQIFGKGIQLFAEGDYEAKVELVDVKKIGDHVIQLHYRVVK